MNGKLASKNFFWKWISRTEGENDKIGVPNSRERSQLNNLFLSYVGVRAVCVDVRTYVSVFPSISNAPDQVKQIEKETEKDQLLKIAKFVSPVCFTLD